MTGKHWFTRRLALSGSTIVLALTFSGTSLAQTAAAPPGPEVANAAESPTQDIVVTGTRRQGVTVVDSVRPVDVISGEVLERAASANLNDALKTAIPSLNVQKFASQDGSAFVRPFSLRGLPPDQTLVLVNGKRRHRSALVQISNQPLAAGAQGPDLATIPAIAIERIEVLRDGAAAQYGSDAIAGVVNFRLKTDARGLTVVGRYGQYYLGDGQDYQVAANLGLPLTDDGFFNISGEYVRSLPTSRGMQRPDAAALTAAGVPGVPNPSQRSGNINIEAARAFFNAELGLGDTARLYAFGNYGWSYSDYQFFFRNPNTRADIFTSVPLTATPGGPRFSFRTEYPGGFTPVFGSRIDDSSVSGGVKGEIGGIDYDLGVGMARSRIDFRLSNTVNASLGPDSPRSFRPGAVVQRETRLNADFVYPWETGAFATPLNIAFGAEWRRESFEIVAGEPLSYAVGPFARVFDPDSGRFVGLAPGSSGYPGYDPSTAGRFGRSNWATYLDLETDVTHGFTIGAAARYERFSDFGGTFNWKVSSRLEATDWLAFRAGYNTGFRAPTPGQSNISDLATSIDITTGGLLLVATRRPSDPIARYYGARPLDRETSRNFSAGVVLDLPGSYVFTVDYFNIAVQDRIGLTARIPITAADRAALLAQGVDPGDVQSVRYFGNFFDTRTQGIDAVFSKAWRFDTETRLTLSAAANYTSSKVSNLNNPLAINRERQIEIGTFNPKWRGNVTAAFESGALSGLLRASYYGKYTDAVPNAVPTANAFDQTFGARVLVDVEVGYDLTQNFRLAAGAENLFDVYPDRDGRLGQQANGVVYGQFSPFGFSGGFWYVRGTAKF
ncbi:MAG: TonB-dependent receptor [Altererythrobacter sp.]|nr:TonB-dependent receptor [Altererythrobacter sp.]